MGFVRFSTGAFTGHPGYLVDDTVIDLTTVSTADRTFGDTNSILEALADRHQLFAGIATSDATLYDNSDVSFEVPTEAGTVVRLDCTYEHDLTDSGYNAHIEKAGLQELDYPSLWIGSRESLTAHGSELPIPREAGAVRPGVELAFVIGKDANNVSKTDALDVIAGCVVCGSLTVYDSIPGLEGYRMYDSFVPCGRTLTPLSTTDPDDLALGVSVNGDQIDYQSTAGFRTSAANLVSYATEVTSLSSGDIVMTGNPVRTETELEPGDNLTAWVQDFGSVDGRVVAEGET